MLGGHLIKVVEWRKEEVSSSEELLEAEVMDMRRDGLSFDVARTSEAVGALDRMGV